MRPCRVANLKLPSMYTPQRKTCVVVQLFFASTTWDTNNLVANQTNMDVSENRKSNCMSWLQTHSPIMFPSFFQEKTMIVFPRKWTCNLYSFLLKLVGGFNHLEKWWTSSVGMMTFLTEWKVIKAMFETTNQWTYSSKMRCNHLTTEWGNTIRKKGSSDRSKSHESYL